jgi:hypothetical protein
MAVQLLLGVSIITALWLCQTYAVRNTFAFCFFFFSFFLQTVFLVDISANAILYNADEAVKAATIALCCSLLLHLFLRLLGIAGALRLDSQPSPKLPTTLSSRDLEIVRRTMIITMVASVTSFAVVIAQTGGISINWESLREVPGYLVAFATLNTFALMASTAVYAVNTRFWNALLLFVPVGLSILVGARIMVAVIGAVLLMLVLQARRLRPVEKVALIAASVPLGLLVHIVLRGLRGFTINELGDLPLDQIEEALSAAFGDWSGGESSVPRAFTFVLATDWQEIGISYFQSLIRAAAAPIPTGAWPGKPVDVGTVVWLEYYLSGLMSLDPSTAGMEDVTEQFLQRLADPAVSFGTVHPFVWGEAWVQAGYAGLFVMPAFYAILIKFLTGILSRLNRPYMAIMVPVLISLFYYIVRGNVAVALANMAYLGVYLYLVTTAISFFTASHSFSADRGPIAPEPRPNE